MERTELGKICNLLLNKVKIPKTMKILATLQMAKSVFPCDHSNGPEKAFGRQPMFHPVRTTYQTQTTRTWCSHSRPDAHRTRPTESTCSHKCQGANAVTANSGCVIHNRPDTLQQLIKNCCLPSGHWLGKSSLCKIKFSRAYLKGLIGCCFVRIQY